MGRKVYQGELGLKAGSEATGEFEAVFATLNVIDHDRDVTVAGAFGEGAEVPVSHYGHDHSELPVGRGVIHERDGKALLEGKFFLDTVGGREHYLTVKNLGGLQQWSYAFDVKDEGKGDFEGQPVRFLKKLQVHEVAPVMVGAGIGTQTVDIKGTSSPAPSPERTDAQEKGTDWFDPSYGHRMHPGVGSATDGEKAVTRSEADGDHPAGHYLVVEDPEKPSTWHLRVRGTDGKADHRLMGAAWAALHGGYRGNVYQGPGKREAIAKLARMYEQEGMDVPKADWNGETKTEDEGTSPPCPRSPESEYRVQERGEDGEGAKSSGEAERLRARIEINLVEVRDD